MLTNQVDVEMRFYICWNKGIRLCFPKIKGIDDNLIEFDKDLVEKLGRWDYLSFNDFFNNADINLLQIPLTNYAINVNHLKM